MYTLTMSPAPIATSAIIDSQMFVERPNTIVAAPNTTTPPNM